MKIAIISTKDIGGGAPRAAYRLHQALLENGHESVMLVAQKSSDDNNVVVSRSKIWKIIHKLASRIDLIPLRRYKKTSAVFSVNWFPDDILKMLELIKPDLVHLHWVGQGFLNIKTIAKIPYPIVWTLHDMWPFTGGCHYSSGCLGYQKSCGSCPLLNSCSDNDITGRIFSKKKSSYNYKKIVVVSPSNWLAQCARSSSLFRDNKIVTIPYNINTNVFKPLDQMTARRILNLPLDKKIVLFGAMSATSDPRKGFAFLQKALHLFKVDEVDAVEVLIYGSGKPLKPISVANRLSYAGVLNDEISLAICYAAADVFVAPSVEDNLPLTVMESLACGTPVVAFNIGGMPDMIVHKRNGYLANAFSEVDLYEGIIWTINNRKIENLDAFARERVLAEYNSNKIAGLYGSVYSEMLKK